MKISKAKWHCMPHSILCLLAFIVLLFTFSITCEAHPGSGPSCASCHTEYGGSIFDFDISPSNTIEIKAGQSKTLTFNAYVISPYFDGTFLPAAYGLDGLDIPNIQIDTSLGSWSVYNNYIASGSFSFSDQYDIDLKLSADSGVVPGDYLIYVTLAGAQLWSLESSFTLRILPTSTNQSPVADPGGPYAGNSVQQIQFDGSGSYDTDGTIVVYAWDFGDSSVGTGVNPTHAYGASGLYTVKLTVTDNEGATDTDSTTVEISSLPPVSDPGGPYNGQANQPVYFDGSHSYDDGLIVMYEWDFGDGNTGEGITATHSYEKAGTYTVTLTVTDDQGSTNIDTTIASIRPPEWIADPDNLLPNPSFEIQSPGTIVPEGWTLWGEGDNSTQQWNSTCSSSVHTGCWSCRLAVGAKGISKAISSRVETDPGQVYYVGAWIQDTRPSSVASAVPAKLRFEYYDSETEGQRDDSQTYDVELMIPPDADWFSWQFDYVELIPSTSHPWVQVSLLVENESDNGGESAYIFDDIWFGRQEPFATSDQFIAVSAGHYHSLGLKVDGSIVGWGNNDVGQASPPPGNDYIAITSYGSHNLALKEDGSIVGWGENLHGELDVPQGNDFVAIGIGVGHGLALKSDGTIVGWGLNDDGQATPPDGNDYIAISAGPFSNLALKSDGSLIAWGRNKYGLDSPPDGNDFIAIAASPRHSAALKSDGSLVGWGDNQYGKSDVPSGNDFVALDTGVEHGVALRSDGSLVGWGTNEYGQTDVPEGNDFIAVTSGGWHNLALRNDGTIVGWGRNDSGQATPTNGQSIIAIAAGSFHSFGLKTDGSIVGWGYNYNGEAEAPLGNDFIAIDAGDYYSIALKADGSIVGWGYNGSGQTDTPPGNDFVAFDAGSSHALALRSDGTIVGWGRNWEGQIDVPTEGYFISVAAGQYHSLALKTDGSIVAWGYNGLGQATPPEGNDFVAIAAGYDYSVALKSDGSIVCWGSNEYDQIDSPPGNDFTAISAGWYHSLALKSDGSVVAWGLDNNGQASPPEGNEFIAIAAGGQHSLGLLKNGTVAGWGDNEFGQANPPEENN